jgi:hypothetical protein
LYIFADSRVPSFRAEGKIHKLQVDLDTQWKKGYSRKF